MSESESVIKIENLSKRYIIRHQAGGGRADNSIRETLTKGARNLFRRLTSASEEINRPTQEEFWALRDLSFDVKRGDVVGIVGRNGAGKSTLLKILSRITEPTSGKLTLTGRVSSLLEVGTGFHAELTGRENIYLNGAILGMSRAEIKSKFDEIVAFAEVEKFLDTQVKHYSSGMYMRLAFAVAVHLDPEILIVDEVLAVGDAEFQRKCLKKMADVASAGRTILFVSHNMAAVQKMCNIAVFIERGVIKKTGPATEIVQLYLTGDQDLEGRFNKAGRRMDPIHVEIIDAWMERNGIRTNRFLFGDEAEVILQIKIKEKTCFAVELILRQEDGLAVAFAPSGLAFNWEIEPPVGEVFVRCGLPAAKFASGRYTIDLLIGVSGIRLLDNIESGLSFEIDSAAIGTRNWAFNQGRGQGYEIWDVNFKVDQTLTENVVGSRAIN